MIAPELSEGGTISTDYLNETMDEDWSHMTEKILNLSLEIIYLLTGEDYEVVKKTTRKHITHREGQRLSKGFTKSRIPTISLPSSVIPEKINNKKILEVTQKIIELLTGETARRHPLVDISTASQRSDSATSSWNLS
ncbi:hypothetical protein AB205_0187590, partial [Aquarana catesbeiana]